MAWAPIRRGAHWLLAGMTASYLCSGFILPAQEAKPAPEAAASEKWFGTLKASGAELRLVFELKRDAVGQYTGTLTSLDQTPKPIALDSVTRADGALVMKVAAIRGEFEGKLSDEDRVAKGTWRQAGSEFPLDLKRVADVPEEKLREAWAGDLKVAGTSLKLQLRVLETEGGIKAKFDSISQSAMGLAATLQPVKGELVFEVPLVHGRFKGKLNAAGDTATGEWVQLGIAHPLELKRTEDPVTQLKRPKRSQIPQEPFPYVVEKVTFENRDAGIKLAGTLTIPSGTGPFPAVVLVSGSGPQDRDESLLGHKPFWILADHLSRNGVAVLRYDDRGVGESTGAFDAATTQDFAGDARAAIEFLPQDHRIDRDRVGLIGHSEGGLVAAMLAASDANLAFAVMLAGPGVPGSEIIATQSKAIMEASGLQGPAMEEQLHAMQEIVNKITSGATMDDVKSMIEKVANQQAQEGLETEEAREQAKSALSVALGQFTGPWFAFFLSYDPRIDLRRVKCPVLALIGEKDLQVLVDVNMPEIEKALKASGRTDWRCMRLPGLNHLFQHAKTGSPMEYRDIEETMSPDALKIISDWIREQTGK